MRIMTCFFISFVLRILLTPVAMVLYLAGAFSRNSSGWLFAIIATLEQIKAPEE